MQDYIYLITVFEECEPWKEPYNYILGDVRSVGWRPTLEMAVEAVETNMCDIWETCYDYACIEELDYGLYPFANQRWFYKYNEKTGRYDEIDEPHILKGRGPIGGIG